MPSRDPRIDAYIAAAQPAVRPVLKEIRAVVHAACPGVEETIKWRTPTFDYKGIMLGMASFKKYTTMGSGSRLMRSGCRRRTRGAGRPAVATATLPDRAAFVRLVKVAAAINEEPCSRAVETGAADAGAFDRGAEEESKAARISSGCRRVIAASRMAWTRSRTRRGSGRLTGS
jgi:hypothetical protein